MQSSIGSIGERTSMVPLPTVSGGQAWIPSSKLKYAEKDNIICNRGTIERACAQERLAANLMDASKRVLEEVNETTTNWQREVDHSIQERIEEINFMFDEMTRQRKSAALKFESLDTQVKRMQTAIEKVKDAISKNNQCFALREARVGIDLCVDEVERKLVLELKGLKGTLDLLEKTVKEAMEQQRVLRSAIYLLDEDLKYKDTAIEIDKHNLRMRATSAKLNPGSGESFCKFTNGQWQYNCAEAIKNNTKQINNAHTLGVAIENLLKQVFEDICNQVDMTNVAFKLRIGETRKLKHMLEERHSNCLVNINELTNLISALEVKLSDKQRSLSLCQFRLSNRSNRPEPESVCDPGQEALYEEFQVLQASICKLKQKLSENNALLRYLKQTSLQLEEEINVKANCLNIDEVQCMTLRESLVFVHF